MADSVWSAGRKPPQIRDAETGPDVHRGTLRTIVTTLLIAFLLAFVVELISRGSPQDALGFLLQLHQPGWTTVAVFALLLLAFDALIGRAHIALLLVGPLFIVLAFCGRQKSLYLGDPLYPADFLYVRQIVELLPLLVRERPWQAALMLAGGLALVAMIVAGWRYWNGNIPALSRRARLIRLVVAVPVLAFFASIMDYATFSWTRDRLQIFPIMWDQKENYAHNGFTLAFAMNLPMAKLAAPDGYSAQAIAAIKPPAFAATVPAERPDIIVVMSESFWDPTRLPRTTITPDPIADVRALQSGHVFSPEFGGMTANVEFEALTGFSNAFLPYGSIPYQQYVRAPLPTLPRFLKNEGYETRAIHPFTGWFWNRAPVYEAFGFDSFMSEETLPPLAKRGPLASDAALTEEIIREADAATRPFFFFAVSLQSHGPYEPNRYQDTTHEVETAAGAWARDSILTYAEGASDASNGLKRLVDWAAKRERPTVIAFFGDHLPPLGPAYVETGFLKEPVPDRRESADAMKLHHETPLVIWSNRTGTASTGTISPAFLPLHVLRTAEISHPYYTGFLGDVSSRYPIVDRHMLIDAAGVGTPDWGRRSDLDPAVGAYRLLQYDLMFGDRFAEDSFFPPPSGWSSDSLMVTGPQRPTDRVPAWVGGPI